MKASRLSVMIVLLTICSCITRHESFPFEGQWFGTWNPLGTSEPGALQISIGADGSGSGTGEFSWTDPDSGSHITETVELVIGIDLEGRVAGTGIWTESIDGSDDVITRTGDLQGHFERYVGSGKFEACREDTG